MGVKAAVSLLAPTCPFLCAEGEPVPQCVLHIGWGVGGDMAMLGKPKAPDGNTSISTTLNLVHKTVGQYF